MFWNSLLFEIPQLTDCSFSNIFPLCQRKKSPNVKTHVTISLEQINTCPQLHSKTIQTVYGKEACQPSGHVACQVQVRRAFRHFNLYPDNVDFRASSHKTPSCISNPIQNFTFPLQYKQASGQTISLSSNLLNFVTQDLNYGPWRVTKCNKCCMLVPKLHGSCWGR